MINISMNDIKEYLNIHAFSSIESIDDICEEVSQSLYGRPYGEFDLESEYLIYKVISDWMSYHNFSEAENLDETYGKLVGRDLKKAVEKELEINRDDFDSIDDFVDYFLETCDQCSLFCNDEDVRRYAEKYFSDTLIESKETDEYKMLQSELKDLEAEISQFKRNTDWQFDRYASQEQKDRIQQLHRQIERLQNTIKNLRDQFERVHEYTVYDHEGEPDIDWYIETTDPERAKELAPDIADLESQLRTLDNEFEKIQNDVKEVWKTTLADRDIGIKDREDRINNKKETIKAKELDISSREHFDFIIDQIKEALSEKHCYWELSRISYKGIDDDGNITFVVSIKSEYDLDWDDFDDEGNFSNSPDDIRDDFQEEVWEDVVCGLLPEDVDIGSSMNFDVEAPDGSIFEVDFSECWLDGDASMDRDGDIDGWAEKYCDIKITKRNLAAE